MLKTEEKKISKICLYYYRLVRLVGDADLAEILKHQQRRLQMKGKSK